MIPAIRILVMLVVIATWIGCTFHPAGYLPNPAQAGYWDLCRALRDGNEQARPYLLADMKRRNYGAVDSRFVESRVLERGVRLASVQCLYRQMTYRDADHVFEGFSGQTEVFHLEPTNYDRAMMGWNEHQYPHRDPSVILTFRNRQLGDISVHKR